VYQDKISGIMTRLAFPVYSRTKDLAELRRLHERATRVHAAVVVPLLAVLIATAPVLVPWLFGPVWQPAVLPSQILAVAGMIAAVLTGYPQVLLAAGRPRALMRFNIGLLAAYVAVVWLTAPYGIVVVAVGVVAIHVGMLIVIYGILFRRVVGVPVGRMVGDIAPGVVGGGALLAVAFPLAALLESVGAPAPIVIGGVALVGLAVHSLVLHTAFPGVWNDLTSLARRIAPARLGGRGGTPVVPSAPPA
jgi:O-antigen/teichoic acid export membrane protein